MSENGKKNGNGNNALLMWMIGVAVVVILSLGGALYAVMQNQLATIQNTMNRIEDKITERVEKHIDDRSIHVTPDWKRRVENLLTQLLQGGRE